MQSLDLLTDAEMSIESVFAAVQGRLPVSHESVKDYSEIDVTNAPELKRRLDQGDWAIVRYTHYRSTVWGRYSHFLVDWTYLSLMAALVILFVGGALRLLPHNEFAAAVLVFGGGALTGIGLAARYSIISSPEDDHSVMLIDGKRQELIYARRRLSDKPVNQLISVPMREVALWFEWEPLADHCPDTVELRLGLPEAAAGFQCEWPAEWITKVRIGGRNTLTEDLEAQARGLSQAIGTQYLGLQE